MNNILNEVEELKVLILNSDEYKEYDKYSSLLEKDKEINSLINRIKELQKDIVSKKSSNEKELEELYDELNNIELYSNYINASKELNILITNIQSNFKEFFDSLVC